jgi:hypothetical protein
MMDDTTACRRHLASMAPIPDEGQDTRWSAATQFSGPASEGADACSQRVVLDGEG